MILPIVNIFINDNTPDNILEILQKQLFITDTITYSQLDGYDGYSERLLVLIDYNNRNNIDTTNADIVLYYSNWMVSVQLNKFGPAGLTYAIGGVTLDKLLTKYVRKRECCKKWEDSTFGRVKTIDTFGGNIIITYNRQR